MTSPSEGGPTRGRDLLREAWRAGGEDPEELAAFLEQVRADARSADPERRVWGPATQYWPAGPRARRAVDLREGEVVGIRHGEMIVRFYDDLSEGRGKVSEFEIDITHLGGGLR